MNLQIPDFDSLPPECLLDGMHPAADEYMRGTRRIQRLITAASARLKPRQTRAVKLHHQGKTNIQISTQLDLTPTTISRYLKHPDAKQLLSLLNAYQSAIDGPNKALRINMLWRIAQRNEHDSPSTAIKAIAEINRMDLDLQPNNNPSGTLVIEINQQQLPRTALDADIPDNVTPIRQPATIEHDPA